MTPQSCNAFLTSGGEGPHVGSGAVSWGIPSSEAPLLSQLLATLLIHLLQSFLKNHLALRDGNQHC